VPLIPNISECDYKSTSLCYINKSKCKSDLKKCARATIIDSNSDNGAPTIRTDELNEYYDDDSKSSLLDKLFYGFLLIIAILFALLVLFVCVRIIINICCPNSKYSTKNTSNNTDINRIQIQSQTITFTRSLV